MNLGVIDQPLLIFGGPYSNLAATEALQAQAQRLHLKPEQVICNGDIVAYCAEPEATIQLIRDWGIRVLQGNCEESLAAAAQDCGCGFESGTTCSLLSQEWYNFSNQRVSQADRLWMAALPSCLELQMAGQRIVLVHGSVDSINEFVFASQDQEAKSAQLERAQTDIVIAGHSGLPFGLPLMRGYWLNSGVIGMPANDGTPDGWYMLLSPSAEGIDVSWHRLQYRVERTVAAMAVEQLAAPYAACLESGIWPSQSILPATEQAQQGQALQLPPVFIPAA